MLEYIANKYGWRSNQTDSLWKKINKQDSTNLVAVKRIIDKYGWLTQNDVGEVASDAIFYVLQHSDKATQIHYLPFVRDAVKKGKTKPKFLALYEDRALMWQGKKQIYGTQWSTDSSGVTQMYPIENEGNVNKRRLVVGLDSIEVTAGKNNFIYITAEK